MGIQNKILVSGKYFTLSFLVFITAMAANLLLFCILAIARTSPSFDYIKTSEPMNIVSLDVSSEIENIDNQNPAEIVQLNTNEEDEQVIDSVIDTVPLYVSGFIFNKEDVTLNLPGIPILSSEISLQMPSEDVSIGSDVKTLTFSEVDILPQKTSGSLPQYPKWAQRDKLEGSVTLRFVVTQEGNVEEVNIHEIEGDERFGTEATKVVMRWSFKPAYKNGRAVSCWCFQKMNFKLPR